MNCNTPYYELRRKIIFDHLEKFKDTSTHSLANILVRDYPEYFKDKEQARGLLRIYRGASGKYHREKIKSNQYYKNV